MKKRYRLGSLQTRSWSEIDCAFLQEDVALDLYEEREYLKANPPPDGMNPSHGLIHAAVKMHSSVEKQESIHRRTTSSWFSLQLSSTCCCHPCSIHFWTTCPSKRNCHWTPRDFERTRSGTPSPRLARCTTESRL